MWKIVVPVLAVAALAYSLYWLISRIKAAAAAAERELREELGAEEPILLERGASFFGVESKGARQGRGNGALALSKDALLFRMWVPARRLDIPLARIQGCKVVKSHLGKSRGRPLVKVLFTNEEGQDDAVAWLVAAGPLKWISAIEEARGA